MDHAALYRHRDQHDVVTAALAQYALLPWAPQPGKHTILAVPPASRLPTRGEALHDSHAEVIARRGAVRWLLEEAQRRLRPRLPTGTSTHDSDGRPVFAIRDGVHLWMYVSTVPCGDASMGILAAGQDPEVSARIDAYALARPAPPPGEPSRGRDGYTRLGVLRTKPGRADAPRVLSMSCSDKIARWSVLGIQGALASLILEPVYIHAIIFGEVDEVMQDQVRRDCARAFHERLGRLEGIPYGAVCPTIHFTDVPFKHSRPMVYATSTTSNDGLTPLRAALCWIADCGWEVLINGQKRGVPRKHSLNPNFRPVLSKLALFELSRTTLSVLGHTMPPDGASYHAAKKAATTYQVAKRSLLGPGAPFTGWIVSGEEWESFDVHGEWLGIA
ncbi:adenosine deaminase/editase [Lactarius quietus]|nr:adenosine deaminase/editase [Lactarius quietus]